MPCSSQAVLWVLILGVFIIPVHANSFDDLNSAYVSSVLQLPAIGDAKPDKIEQSSGHIRGWIDIVGFKEVAKLNGSEVNYINGTPSDKAIIQYASWAIITVPVCSIDIKNSVTKTISGSNTIANLNIKLVWYSKHCVKNGCTCVEHNESASFSDVEESPVQYPASSVPQLTVHEFKNSSKALLEVNIDDTVTSYTVSSGNGSVVRHLQVGQVMYSKKGVPYANFTRSLPVWKSTGHGVYHQWNDITLDNNNFSFTARTPFGNVSGANITRVQRQPTAMSPLNIFIILIIAMGLGACKLAAMMVKL